MEKVIIGIDPGSRLCGWGAVIANGNKVSFLAADTIDLRTISNDSDKIISIYDELNSVIDDINPSLAAIETPFYHKNPQSLIKLTQARTAAIVAIMKREVPLSEYSPLEIKKNLTGKGRADKNQVAYMVSKMLSTSLDHLNNDATDALAIAICRFLKPIGSQAVNKAAGNSSWAEFAKQNPNKVK